MLATLWEYGWEQLGTEEQSELQRSTRTTISRWRSVKPELQGEDLGWLRRLDPEISNLEAVLEWALVHDVETVLRMGRALSFFWLRRGRWREGRSYRSRRCARHPPHPCPSGRAR
jgi:hypothetical protein